MKTTGAEIRSYVEELEIFDTHERLPRARNTCPSAATAAGLILLENPLRAFALDDGATR
jgi:hypothetical protein